MQAETTGGELYQVVAVYPSGREFPVREPHDDLYWAGVHLHACERQLDAEDERSYRYAIRIVEDDR